MTRVCLYSEDRALQSLLGSALGKEFRVFLNSDAEEIGQLLSRGECDVVLLDLNSHHEWVQERIDCAQRLAGSEPPWVIMADDGLRATANELVQQGAYGYCRRPPSIRDLRIMLLRAHESSALRTQLQTTQQQLESINGCDRMGWGQFANAAGLPPCGPRHRSECLGVDYRTKRNGGKS